MPTPTVLSGDDLRNHHPKPWIATPLRRSPTNSNFCARVPLAPARSPRSRSEQSVREGRKKISDAKSGLPKNLPLPVVSEKRIPAKFRIFRFQNSKIQKNS